VDSGYLGASSTACRGNVVLRNQKSHHHQRSQNGSLHQIAGLNGLWRIPASGGTPTPLTGGGEDAGEPAISSKGDRLAYVHFHGDPKPVARSGPGLERSAPGSDHVGRLLALGFRWRLLC
jgi:hypothetical protein